MSQERADATLQVVEAHGINHIDTARSYGDSELRLAPWLATNRPKVFLATKTGERSGREARTELEESLTRLGVDQVDLIELHNLVEPEEWDAAFAPGGVVEALTKARDEGLCRFIGVTGHGVRIPSMHLRSLQAFDFDSVLLPYNFVLLERPDYRADVEALLQLCAERDVAVQTIKAIARGRWSGSREGKFSWYEPLTDSEAIARRFATCSATRSCSSTAAAMRRCSPRFSLQHRPATLPPRRPTNCAPISAPSASRPCSTGKRSSGSSARSGRRRRR